MAKRQRDTASADGRILLRNFPSDTVFSPSFALLAKAAYPAQTRIQNELVKQYQTGVFFKDLTFKEGLNRVSVAAVFPDGSVSEYVRDIYYQPQTRVRPVFPLWIDTASISLKQAWQGMSSDPPLALSFQGSKGQSAYLEVRPGGFRLPMVRKDFADYSVYQTELLPARLKNHTPYTLSFVLKSTDKRYRRQLPQPLSVAPPDAYPVLRIRQDKTPVSWNLGPIRLGGPLVGEYPKGVLFQSCGKIGDFYRVRLDGQREGVVAASAVESLPLGTPRPRYFLPSVSVSPARDADILRIPYLEPVPYSVEVAPGGEGLRIMLYGVQTSSTWMTHRAGLRMVDLVTWEQVSTETYQLHVKWKSPVNWGYTLEPEGKSLVLRVKHPPVLSLSDTVQPLKGLKVSIEAGHGGWNTGAEGLSGLLEKDVNLDVSLRLASLCRDAGIEVLQIRPSDTYMTLEAKRSAAERYQPHLHLSIHSNSGGGGYLGANGVSTYYHNALWEPFARSVYAELLALPLKEFGMVGSFNYHVTRMSSQPSILVELAFLSHAEDEEKLASPLFRQELAERILAGIKQYVVRAIPIAPEESGQR
jgi:N-acetylmuramoyl-L-alanine amidase